MRKKLTIIGVAVLLLSGAVAGVLMLRPWARADGALAGATVSTPRAVRTFRGPDDDPLRRPVGILVSDGRVYVADAERGVIDVFSPGGHHFTSWGRGVLQTPVAVARHPKTGDFYVSDRGLAAVMVFDGDGEPTGEFSPKIPDAAAWSTTPTALWAPVGLDFAPDGTLYVADTRTLHRLLVFGADGRFSAIAGSGLPQGSAGAPGTLQFPSGVTAQGDEVWVADSNSQRLLVYALDGTYLRAIATPGLPRGLAFAPGVSTTTALVVDTLAHRIAEWDALRGAERGGFGTRGSGEAQFSYPNAVSTGEGDLVFVADTGNARVAVWSWTGRTGAFGGNRWWWALLGVPLLPLAVLPFWLRRPRYFVTADFVRALSEAGHIEVMIDARAKWECLPEDLGALQVFEGEGGPILTAVKAVRGSESDERALRDRYHLDEREAAVLSAARGATALLTEDEALLRVARVVGLAAESQATFVERASGQRGVVASRM